MSRESGAATPTDASRVTRQTSLVLGLGYVGVALVRQLLDEGQTVVGLDNLFSTDHLAVEQLRRHPRFRFIEGSIADPAALDAAFSTANPVDVVYLLAAQASGHPQAAPPEYTEETNLRGPRLVVEAMRRAGVRRIVYASSLKILGEPLPPLVAENSPYGVQTDLAHLSKVYVEKYLEMAAHRADDLSAVAVRLGLVYGVGPVVKRDPRFMTAPNKFCQQAIRGETLEVRATGPVGVIHVHDAARALRASASLAPERGYRAINAPVEVTTIADVARLVVAVAQRRGIEARATLPSRASLLSGGEGADHDPSRLDTAGEPPAKSPSPTPARRWGEGAAAPSVVAEAPAHEALECVEVASSLTTTGFRLTRLLEDGIPELFDYLLTRERPS